MDLVFEVNVRARKDISGREAYEKCRRLRGMVGGHRAGPVNVWTALIDHSVAAC